MWVKFGIRELFVTLLNTGEFRENQLREGIIFVGESWIIYACTVKLSGFLKVKKKWLGKFCVFRHGMYHLQFCLYLRTLGDVLRTGETWNMYLIFAMSWLQTLNTFHLMFRKVHGNLLQYFKVCITLLYVSQL